MTQNKEQVILKGFKFPMGAFVVVHPEGKYLCYGKVDPQTGKLIWSEAIEIVSDVQ